MSRCYPFPPPGYEKKIRIEDLCLLKKEKDREKKHKKEKRDREKKEKREGGRSDNKQKEKKEKHRDKRKDEKKVRNKDKNNHDEKKFSGHIEGEKRDKNFEKREEREINGVVLGKNNHLVSEKNNIKQFHDSGKKIGTEKGNLFGEKYSSTEIRKDLELPRTGVTTPVTPMATSERKVNDRRIDINNTIDKYKEKVKKIKDKGEELLVEQSKQKGFAVTGAVAPGKRKELSCNGVLSEGLNKVPRIMSSSRKPLQNETGSRPSQDSSITTPVKQNSKENRINGTNNSVQSSSRSSSRAVKKLLPHPDIKYLPQVLSVPSMEDWSGFDEQEWLFRSSSSSSSSSSMVNRVDDDDKTVQQVWAEAVRIESVDVYALPYVIPR